MKLKDAAIKRLTSAAEAYELDWEMEIVECVAAFFPHVCFNAPEAVVELLSDHLERRANSDAILRPPADFLHVVFETSLGATLLGLEKNFILSRRGRDA